MGLGVGGLMALCQAIIGDVVSPRERGRYQGYIGSVFGLATVAGPLLGGFLVEHLSWRWCFWVGIPIGIAALVVTERVLKLPFPRRRHAIDLAGRVPHRRRDQRPADALARRQGVRLELGLDLRTNRGRASCTRPGRW